MEKEQQLLTFPCHFKIKIVGNNTDYFEAEMTGIIKKHFIDTKDEAIHKQFSQNNTYVSLSIMLYVEDKSSLDALYEELTAHPETKWVL